MRGSIRSIAITLAVFFIVIGAAPLNDSSTEQVTQDWLQSSLLKAPSLQLHVTLTGKNMEIHGEPVFDIFANPIVSKNGTHLYYNGFVDFREDGREVTYMLVDGVSYVVETTRDENNSTATQTVRCYSSDIPFDAILSSLNGATAIPSAYVNGEVVNCPGGSLFQTSIDDTDFVLCALGTSGLIAYGRDMRVMVGYLSSPIRNISAPIRHSNAGSCPVVATPAPVTPTAISLLTGETIPVSTSRNLKEAISITFGDDKCECKSTRRPCIFLHGLGNPNEKAELQDTPKLTKEKFGDIGDHAPCCTTVKYAVMNTVDYGWTSDKLQQKFCDFSLSMSTTSDLSSRTISNTIIVTHSMGGLVMASALATGKCKFSESTSWVSLSAPMKGSMAGNYIQDLCDDEFTSVGADLLELIGQCPASAARRSIAYQGEKYSNKKLDAAYKKLSSTIYC